jgi:hypothetical protein
VPREAYLWNTAREIKVDTIGGCANSLSIYLDIALSGGILLQRQARGLSISIDIGRGKTIY